jgi:rfaE bifunctional protein kinase chain/domain
MKTNHLSKVRARQVLSRASRTRVLVVGDLMLDHFIWGNVARISPEAPVPVLEFERENLMPGGAANVARNLTSLKADVALFGVVGDDLSGRQLRQLLNTHGIRCQGVIACSERDTSVKTRIVAHQQQIVRIDRECCEGVVGPVAEKLVGLLEKEIPDAAAVIVCDYGKGVVTQDILNHLKGQCKANDAWLSLDPKPIHQLDLSGLSLLTPNRKEAFELANIRDETRNKNPLADENLMRVAERLLNELRPEVLLITLGELGMLLCQRWQKPLHIPTVAQEVFDVSGAGDTVIASFTLAIAAGGSPVEAASLSNHAAGIVVGKVGTATTSIPELIANVPTSSLIFKRKK